MPRIIDAATLAALDQSTLRPVYLVELQLDGGDIYFSGSTNSYTVNSKTYIGGNLGSVSSVDETQELEPSSCNITLSGVDAALKATLVSENYVNRTVLIYQALLDESDAIIGEPFVYFDGLISSLVLSYSGTSEISITLKNRLALWNRAKIRRYTHQEQQAKYPSDKGFEFVEQIANAKVIWPTREYLKKIS